MPPITKICLKCRSEARAEDSFCSKCGAGLEEKKEKVKKRGGGEVITCLCLDCLASPEKLKPYVAEDALKISEIPEFFNRLAKAGKNPSCIAVLTERGINCLTKNICGTFEPDENGFCKCLETTNSYEGNVLHVGAVCNRGHKGFTELYKKDENSVPKPAPVHEEISKWIGAIADGLALTPEQRQRAIDITVGKVDEVNKRLHRKRGMPLL